jgi:hypothetical protein
MPRKPKIYRYDDACQIDEQFFVRSEKALGAQLNDNARALIRFSITRHNQLQRLNRENCKLQMKRLGRRSDPNIQFFVDGLLDVIEGEVGIFVRASKRIGKSADGKEVAMPGPVPAFLRVVWDAIEIPDRNADGFARLVSNSAPWLGKTVEDRRSRRAESRKPRDEYIERMRNAWKSRPSDE